jgi:hypothetical protein
MSPQGLVCACAPYSVFGASPDTCSVVIVRPEPVSTVWTRAVAPFGTASLYVTSGPEVR